MPRNQIFDFKPSKLDSKDDEDRCGLCIKPTNSRGLTALTDYTNYRSCFKLCQFKNMMILLKPLALMLQTSARLFYAIFYFACNSTLTADRRHFLKPNYVIQVLIYCKLKGKFLKYSNNNNKQEYTHLFLEKELKSNHRALCPKRVL